MGGWYSVFIGLATSAAAGVATGLINNRVIGRANDRAVRLTISRVDSSTFGETNKRTGRANGRVAGLATNRANSWTSGDTGDGANRIDDRTRIIRD